MANEFSHLPFDSNNGWSIVVKYWTKTASEYVCQTESVAEIIYENFPTTASYRVNADIIKRSILEGLGEDSCAIIHATNQMLYKKKSKEDQEIFAKRSCILKKVSLISILFLSINFLLNID